MPNMDVPVTSRQLQNLLQMDWMPSIECRMLVISVASRSMLSLSTRHQSTIAVEMAWLSLSLSRVCEPKLHEAKSACRCPSRPSGGGTFARSVA
jgi:hypothetical protein